MEFAILSDENLKLNILNLDLQGKNKDRAYMMCSINKFR